MLTFNRLALTIISRQAVPHSGCLKSANSLEPAFFFHFRFAVWLAPCDNEHFPRHASIDLAITEVKAGSIIKIFAKLIFQKFEVFIAMPYFDDNDKVVAEYNKIYGDVISEIASKYKIQISHYSQ